MTVTRARPDDTISRRTMRTTLSMRDPGSAWLTIPTSGEETAMRVAIALATLPSRP